MDINSTLSTLPSVLSTVILTTVAPNASTTGGSNTTEDPDSDLSSFEEFCGDSPFWDTDLLLDSPYPKFTKCFREVALAWMPCMLYLVGCLPYFFYLSQKPSVRPMIGTVCVVKTICTMCLVGITIATIIVRATDDDQDSIPDALYVSEGLKLACFLLTLVVSHVERRKGVITSPPSWMFWFILFILGIIPFYSNFKEDKRHDDEFGFIIFIFYWAFVIVSLIIASFVEPRSDEYQDMSKSYNGNPCPANYVSFPSRISFQWMTSLVVLGFKKTLGEDDIFDLDQSDRCTTLMPAFQEAWEKEKERVDKYNSKVVPKKPVFQDVRKDRWADVFDEKSPLIATVSKAKKDGDEKEKPEKSPYKTASVFRALMAKHGFLLFGSLTAKACVDMFIFVTPKITEALLDYITYKDNYHEWRGYVLAASYFVVNSIVTVGSNQSIFYTKRAGLRMKASLINAVYRKSLTAASIGDETTKGEVVNLMSVDCQRIEDLAYYINVVFSAPAQIALAVYLLYDQLGVAMFAGLGVLSLTVPVNAFIGSFFQKWQIQMMKHKDERIKLLSEVLNGIKVLKLYAWESSFQAKIDAIRKKELIIIRNISLLIACLLYFFIALPNLVQVAAFAVYVDKEGYLDPTVAFVSLQLFSLLNGPLNVLPLFIPIMIQTIVSIRRISEYLNKPDIKKDTVHYDRNAVNAIEIENGNFTWTIEQPIATLRDINVEIKPGSLVAVVGTVGCGKSSLLSSILGEMERLTGTVTLKGSIAYVPQEAWIQNATLRDNITFGKQFRQRKYDQVIEACALRADLSILPGGDKTEIGEKGINVSGGQKQRVSLARAVYSDQEIYLLDDPLSAVDAHVGKHIFNEVIGDKGMLKRKTRVLVTHGVQWLPMVDKIFCVSNGEISESGTYTELMDKDGDFAHFIREYAQENNDNSSDSDKDDTPILVRGDSQIDSNISETSGDFGRSRKLSSAKKPHRSQPGAFRRKSSKWDGSSIFDKSLDVSLPAGRAGIKLTEDEMGGSGNVKLDIYLYYLREVGFTTVAVACILYLCYAGCACFGGIWLTEWTSDSYLLNRSNKDTSKYDDKTDEYLGVYAAASIGQGLFILIFSIIAAFKMADAAEILHKNMLGNILRSPMSFFDTTPSGRIMNRFSRDVDVLDNILPLSMKQIMNLLGLVVITIVNISYGTPIFLAALLPLSIIYLALQVLYVPTCRQLRRINSTTRSPIYVHFSETLSGSASIRAYGVQERFIDESMKKIDHNVKFYFASTAAANWLSFRLQFLGNLVVFAAAIFAVSASDIDPSVVGLSVSYATSMTQALEQLVNVISETETNIVSVERMKEYTNSAQEAPWIDEHHRPNSGWPDKGNVVFDNYQTRYRPGLDLVLHDVTCSIKGGEKIGIVGRTGAGKSSMTVALFRIIEAAGGKIIIDGEDVSQMGLHDLRNKITILPQEPVIFSGTMRMNLDPFDKYSEPELWHSLEHSYLKEFVKGLPGQLDYECGEEGSNLSVGQRQLVCLARTLLRKTKILVLDEATAAVDMETDDLIQQTIHTQFAECTVLTIAHRLNTIIDYDRVMVLDRGFIKEFDSPKVLLADDKGVFHGMAKDAGLV